MAKHNVRRQVNGRGDRSAETAKRQRGGRSAESANRQPKILPGDLTVAVNKKAAAENAKEAKPLLKKASKAARGDEEEGCRGGEGF